MASPAKKRRVETASVNDVLPNTVLQQIFSNISLGEKLEYMNVCGYWSELIGDNLKQHKEMVIVPTVVGAYAAIKEDRCNDILSRQGFTKSLSLCPSLRVLDLMAATGFDAKYMKFVSTVTGCCKQLTVLKLPPTSVTVSESVTLARGLTLLEELEVRGCNFSNYFLCALFAASKTTLRVLNVADNAHITSTSFSYTPVSLQKLIIDGCGGVSPDIFGRMLSTCKDTLTHLSIRGVKGITVTHVKLVQFRQLKELHHISIAVKWHYYEKERRIWGKDGNDDDGDGNDEENDENEMDDENEYWRPYAQLSKLPKLRALTVDYQGCYTACIFDKDIGCIAKGCPELENLNISPADVECLTTEGLRVLKDAQNLRKLDVSSLTDINDDCLEVFATLPHLHTLAAMQCANVSNAGMRSLAIQSTSLRELDISGNCKLDADLSILAQFRDSGPNRSGVLSIYFGATGLAKVYLALSEREKQEYTAGGAKLELYPYAH